MTQVSGGQSLGVARGTITLDVSQLQVAAQTARTLARQIQDSIVGIDTGSKTATSGLTNLTKGVTALRTELIAVGAASGILTKLGLDGAKNVRNYTIAFQQFVGSQKEAVSLMEDLTKRADQFGLEVEGVWQLGRSLLPVLKGNTSELDEWVKRAALLRSVFPTAQKGAETRAISEFLAGQDMSLQRLFNVPPALIQQAKSQFSDYGQQLDFILQRMGATEAGALAMADGFAAVRNELTLAAATGFTPLLQSLTPVLHGFAEWLAVLRQSHPAVLQFGAGIAGIAAVGAPSLLLLNQLVKAGRELAALGILGGLGKAGLIGIGLGGAAVAGTATANAIGRATGNESAANATVTSILQRMGQMLLQAAVTINQFTTAIRLAITDAVMSFVNGVASMVSAMGSFVRAIAALLPVGGEGLTKNADLFEQTAQRLRGAATAIGDSQQKVTAFSQAVIDAMARVLTPGPAAASGPAAGMVRFGGVDLPTDAITEWATSVEKIERDAAQARQEATAGYEQQRTETIRQYETAIAREAEDYGRQRARAEQQLQKQLSDITSEQKSREAQYAIDLADSIADITNDGNQRIAELEHDYQKNRERALEEHNDRLFDAVGSLDAKALAEENRRFARSSKNAEDDFSDRIAKEKAQINQRVQDEIEANDKRIQEGRKADLQRSIDLQAAFDDQRKQEDEDRGIRLQRMAEDHQAQLDQMDAAQGQRLQQIDDHAAQERTELDNEFVKQLTQLGIHNNAWTTAQKDFQDKSLESFKAYWKSRLEMDNKALAELVKPGPHDPIFGPPAPGDKSKNSFFPGFADGGPVYKTGLALVHQGEYVLSRAMLNGAGGPSGGSKAINVAEGAIQIFAAPNQSAGDIGEVVKGHFMDLIASL